METKTLSDNITTEICVGNGCFDETDYPILNITDVKESLKKLKERGLHRTTYPKYLMITFNDMKEIFGDKLL